jgi:hypothetical protein
MSGPRFETGTSEIRSRFANHSVATFSVSDKLSKKQGFCNIGYMPLYVYKLFYSLKRKAALLIKLCRKALAIVRYPDILKLLFSDSNVAAVQTFECRSVKISKLISILEIIYGRLAKVAFCSYGKQQHDD